MNPYTAPETPLSPSFDPHEVSWAWDLRAKRADAERGIRIVSWLNFLMALPFGGVALFAIVVLITGATVKGLDAFQKQNGALFIAIGGFGLAAVNLWIWYGLRRFLRGARWLDIGLSLLVFFRVFRGIAQALETGAPQGFWLGSVAVPSITAGVILGVLITRTARSVFNPEYQRALAITRRVPYQVTQLSSIRSSV